MVGQTICANDPIISFDRDRHLTGATAAGLFICREPHRLQQVVMAGMRDARQRHRNQSEPAMNFHARNLQRRTLREDEEK
jgi:hypothetical protein